MRTAQGQRFVCSVARLTQAQRVSILALPSLGARVLFEEAKVLTIDGYENDERRGFPKALEARASGTGGALLSSRASHCHASRLEWGRVRALARKWRCLFGRQIVFVLCRAALPRPPWSASTSSPTRRDDVYDTKLPLVPRARYATRALLPQTIARP